MRTRLPKEIKYERIDPKKEHMHLTRFQQLGFYSTIVNTGIWPVLRLNSPHIDEGRIRGEVL